MDHENPTIDSLLLTDLDLREFRTFLDTGLRCTTSPGESKNEKLITIARRLSGPGLVIAPDDDRVAYIVECFDKSTIGCVSLSLANDPEENRAVADSLRSGDYKILVAELSCGDYLPPYSFRFMIHWNLPSSLREFVYSFRYLIKPESEKFSILLYDPADRYHQEEIIIRRYGTDAANRNKVRAAHIELDVMEGYAVTGGCRIGYIKKMFRLEPEPADCGYCDNCRKTTAEQSLSSIGGEQSRVLLRCIAETREKFGMNLLTDVLRGIKSGKILEYNLQKSSTFGVLRENRRNEIVELFRDHIRHGCLKRTTGAYPTLYLTSIGKRFLGNTPVQPLELPKKMKLRTGEKLDVALMEAVRNYRRSQAKILNIPAFLVFSDTILKRIVQKCPQTEEDLKNVRGFGETKWHICGAGLLQVIRSYVSGMEV